MRTAASPEQIADWSVYAAQVASVQTHEQADELLDEFGFEDFGADDLPAKLAKLRDQLAGLCDMCDLPHSTIGL